MVTTSQIPDEANEPPEPHPPNQDYSSSPIDGLRSGSPRPGLQNGGPVGSSAAASPAPAPVLSIKEAHQPLDSLKSSDAEIVSSTPIAYDYATEQPNYSPTGTTAVVSEQDFTEKLPSYHGIDPHLFPATQVAKCLEVTPENGLSSQDAQARLARDGPNKLEGDEGVGMWRVLVRQVSNSLTLVSTT